MTDTTPPPGAIIPPRIGEIGLTLPEGWWLMRYDDAAELGGEWECADGVAENPHWLPTDSWTFARRTHVIARRRIVQVTVDAQPGDRVVVIPNGLFQRLDADLDDRNRAVWSDARYNAVVAQ